MPLENDINKFVYEYHVTNHEEAKIRANNLINKYPKNTKLLITLGILFAQNSKIEDAIIIFKKIKSLKKFIRLSNRLFVLIL